MKIVAISDTHTYHRYLTIPECDVLIVAGDFSWKGRFMEVLDFVTWLREQPAKHKLVVAGNHELSFDRGCREYDPSARALVANDPFQQITYLENKAVVIDGVKFYGTPYTPWFHDWGFNGVETGTHPFTNIAMPKLAQVYGGVDDDTNVLICHGPCYGLVDRGGHGNSDDRLGSTDLLRRTQQLNNLKLTISGHIHEARGVTTCEDKVYANVASLDRQYDEKKIRPPVVFELIDNNITVVSGYEDSNQPTS